jgi:hypothetical protein
MHKGLEPLVRCLAEDANKFENCVIIFVMMKKLIFSLVLVILFAACTPQAQVAELPTVADFPTFTPTDTPSITPTFTDTPTGTLSPSPEATVTPSISVTPSVTITDTSTPTATATITPTPETRPVEDLLEIALHTTVLPPPPTILTGIAPSGATLLPGTSVVIVATSAPVTTAACTFQVTGGFALIYNSNPTLSAQLGCAINNAATLSSAYQSFEHGAMLWLQGTPSQIYLLYPDGRYTRFTDTYDPAIDPESGGETPPAGFVEPVRGFGKIWRTYQDVRLAFGWATGNELGGTSTIQDFGLGRMVSLSQRGEILVLVDNGSGLGGTWQAIPGSY